MTQSFDLVEEFPTTSSKPVGGSCWYKCVQSKPDSIEEERAHNDELTWLSKIVGEISTILRDSTQILLQPLRVLSLKSTGS